MGSSHRGTGKVGDGRSRSPLEMRSIRGGGAQIFREPGIQREYFYDTKMHGATEAIYEKSDVDRSRRAPDDLSYVIA